MLLASLFLFLASSADSVNRDSVTYANGSITLAATLLRPREPGLRPAIVIVHGSGPSARDNPWTTAYADALASRGVVVLYPDKRGSGSSTGNWREASIGDLAGDASAGIAFLRKQPGVDTTRIGVLGFSQGGYVASVVAADDPHNAFSAAISGGTASLLRQTVDELLNEANANGRSLARADSVRLENLYSQLFRFASKGTGWQVYSSGLKSAKASKTLASIVRSMPTDSTHWAIGWVRHMGDFDAMPQWARVNRPVLLIYGGKDPNVRVDATLDRLRRLPPAQRLRFTTMVLGGNGHALFRDDAVAFLAEWIKSGGAN